MASTTPKQSKPGESLAERLERAVSNVANAASVAATGSELGVLELAVEDDLGMRKAKKKPVPKRAKKAKTAKKKKTAKKTKKPAVKRRKIAAKRPRKPARKAAKKKRVAKRRAR